jgi:A/G-specific adenine glycosylase
MPPTPLREKLLAWYDAHRRELPWRAAPGETPDPYRVWLSEVMLQQTQVETVRPYFERWLERFPTLADLAAAPQDEVLKAWEGLGYYSRARNLHRAVREVAERWGGRVPDDPGAFRALPGVGRYTAGAVMSIAFGRPEPLVDGNVRRVFARWTDDPAPTDARLWELAGRLVPGERPGDLNQALMELGAMVCTPRAPRCTGCPAADQCAARAAGTQAARPAPRRAAPLPTEETAVAVIERGGRLLLARRSRGRLASLWMLPQAVRADGETLTEAVERATRDGLGVQVRPGEQLSPVRHTFTHVRAVYHPVRCLAPSGEPAPIHYDELAWATRDDLRRYALPVAQRKIAGLVFG